MLLEQNEQKKSKVVNGGRDRGWEWGVRVEGIKQDAQTTVSILAFTLSEMDTIRES